jgi:hypothetical protein
MAANGLIVRLPDNMAHMSMESHDGMILTGENRRTQEKNRFQFHFAYQKFQTY